ncbi:efflux RND transporter periplasmic adaptor subunit [Pseudoalteromonas denitrificans]|uniref:HlyD family secretion protein n=1 Tax=Pseudoalteromonas denitrificans DSM 6059 TaxID=1123010 RepID=A0A1I1MZ63_9GAMM|nr:HlyD family efflux transporter periplasmic adaptor subunit [Pseudoalteromonas denitrificans]SFC90465.1 HlyD family secretion protein [Pseudoalteromonas denitrificans DSM 6059]
MKIELNQKKSWKKGVLITLFVSLLSYAAYAVSSKSVKSVSADTLRFQTVKSGPIDIYATAYGEFISAKERLLTAPALGKVSEILVRPGTQVTPDTVILHLFNPKLNQEVSEAQGLLAQQKAQREAFKYEQQNERLNYQSSIADIEAEIEKALLELSVNQKLLNLGVASQIELQRAQLSVEQQNKRLKFEKEKYQQFIEMQSYQLTQRDITITQQISQVLLLEQQLEDMKVKAGITGSLQTLEIELGQSVQLGESLAKVGSDKELIARLRLPQHQADQIDINAPVIIDTQKGLIKAHISRIESLVTNGSILAEAIIDGELTSNSRPSLTVSAQVFIKHQKDALFIDQVSGLRPRSKQALFVQTNNSLLEQKEVTFGEISQGQLVIANGLNSGDKIVSSDTNKYVQFNQLSVIQ